MRSMTGNVRGGAVLVTALLLLAGCSSDDTSDPGDTATAQDPATAADDTDDGVTDDGDGDDGAAAAAGQGTLTIDGEQATIERVMCFLEPQDAGGDQTIEATAQAQATSVGGEDVLLDFSRFSEGGPAPAGDSVSVTFGDVTSPDAKTYSALATGGLPPAGTVSVDGSVVSVTDLALADEDGGPDEISVSFDLPC